MKKCEIKFSQKRIQNLRYKSLYVIGFWKPKQCWVTVFKYLFNAMIKSDYLAIFVIWPQSLNCLFHVRIAIFDMGRAGGRVVRKNFGVFCHESIVKHVSGKFSAPFLSHSVSCTEGFVTSGFAIYVETIIYLLWYNLLEYNLKDLLLKLDPCWKYTLISV